MKSRKEIKDLIKEIEDDYAHVLNCYPATVQVNAPRALMQLSAKSQLQALYWVLGQERPKYKADDSKHLDG